MVAKLLPPQSASIEIVAHESGVSVQTLERWRSQALLKPATERMWTAAARLEAVISTAALDESASPRVTIVVAPIGSEHWKLGLFEDGGGRLWSLWSKARAVGNANALSTASGPVRAAHRPQIQQPLVGAGRHRPSPLRFLSRG